MNIASRYAAQQGSRATQLRKKKKPKAPDRLKNSRTRYLTVANLLLSIFVCQQPCMAQPEGNLALGVIPQPNLTNASYLTDGDFSTEFKFDKD